MGKTLQLFRESPQSKSVDLNPESLCDGVNHNITMPHIYFTAKVIKISHYRPETFDWGSNFNLYFRVNLYFYVSDPLRCNPQQFEHVINVFISFGNQVTKKKKKIQTKTLLLSPINNYLDFSQKVCSGLPKNTGLGL